MELSTNLRLRRIKIIIAKIKVHFSYSNMSLKKQTILFISLILSISLALPACDAGSDSLIPTVAVSPTLPPPNVQITSVSSASDVAQSFLENWQAEGYTAMYDLLSSASKVGVNQEAFIQFYKEAAINLTLQTLDFEILSSFTDPNSAEIRYRVIFHTELVGDLQREITMNLITENGSWQVQWQKGLVMPELSGNNQLVIDIASPERGSIYDNEGSPIVEKTDAYAVRLTTGAYKGENWILYYLSQWTGKTQAEISSMYDGLGPGWDIPIGNAAADEVDATALLGLTMISLIPYTARYYYGDGFAAQTIGYTMPVPAEEINLYQRRGYRGDDLIGMSSLEKWSENDLSGVRGADLYVVDSEGQIVTRLANSQPQPANSIHTTLDNYLQDEAQLAISGFRGAIIVLEQDTGRVLAMASSPTFDPNIFAPQNVNSGEMLEQLLNDREMPLLNRASQGGYPLGSVSKIITMAAALESGLYTPDSTYYCDHEFNELPDITLYDWTYAKDYPPSGELTLIEGLIRSCNPWFYHIGLDLYRQNMPTAIAEMARGFGLGKATGIGQIAEDPGSFPDPANEGDAVQLSIGQGAMLATPLQVAVFIAAIGNGGTLYRPQLIERITDPNEQDIYSFQPQINGYLPIGEETLQSLQQSMGRVVSDRIGTAYEKFTGLYIPVHGKTGTAQNPFGDAHSWFAGYSNTGGINHPDISVVVIAENAGEGSEVSALIFRRVLEVYFTGRPRTKFPWESQIYVRYTPTPLYPPTNTPIPPTRTPVPEEPEGTGTPEP